jgi:uncharacterized membrane protein YjfL (UPF0719 family)
MLPIYAYAEHLLASLVLLVVFVGVYTRITPFNEFALIRQGNVAAALAGWQHARFLLHAVVELQHNDTFLMFLVWSLVAMVVQAVVYARWRAHCRIWMRPSNLTIWHGRADGRHVGLGRRLNAACLS